MDGGAGRGLGAARIDDDQLHAAFDGRPEIPGRILTGDSDRFGDQRIRPDQHPAVGLMEVDVAAQPVTVGGQRNLLAGLVDGVGREEHR